MLACLDVRVLDKVNSISISISISIPGHLSWREMGFLDLFSPLGKPGCVSKFPPAPQACFFDFFQDCLEFRVCAGFRVFVGRMSGIFVACLNNFYTCYVHGFFSLGWCF